MQWHLSRYILKNFLPLKPLLCSLVFYPRQVFDSWQLDKPGCRCHSLSLFSDVKKMAKIDKAGTKQKINKQWPSEDYNQTYPHRRKSVMKAPIWQNIIVQDILPRLPRRGFEIFWVMSKVKIQLQNPDQTSASKLSPNLSLKVLTIIQIQNIDQISASKCRLNSATKSRPNCYWGLPTLP